MLDISYTYCKLYAACKNIINSDFVTLTLPRRALSEKKGRGHCISMTHESKQVGKIL